MAHFGLIHGAWHGGWCWSKTASLLREAGHQVSAPDLPGHGARGRWRWRAGGVSMGDYIDSVADMVLRAPAPLILVGHSMGGMVITGAAERHPDKGGVVCILLRVFAAVRERAGRLSARGFADHARRPATELVAWCGADQSR